MNKSVLSKGLIGVIAAAGLVFAGIAPAAQADYAPNVSSVTVTRTPTGNGGSTVSVGVKINSKTEGPWTSETVKVYIGGKTYSGTTNSSGTTNVKIKMPSKAGVYSMKVISNGKTSTKTVTVGKKVTPSVSRPKSVKAKKTTTISGKVGNISGKVKITITIKGKKTTKTVSVRNGKYSLKYKTSKKGTYKVSVSYVTDSKYYATTTKSTTFKAK